MLGTAHRREPRASARETGKAQRSLHNARRNLRLPSPRARYCRPEGHQGVSDELSQLVTAGLLTSPDEAPPPRFVALPIAPEYSC